MQIKIPELITLDSIVAELEAQGVTEGLVDPSQFASMISPDKVLVGEAALLGAVYGTAPEHEGIRQSAMRLGSKAREETLGAVQRYELQAQRAGIDIGQGLTTVMPTQLSEKLYGTTAPVEMFGTQYDRLATDISKLREQGYREAVKKLG